MATKKQATKRLQNVTRTRLVFLKRQMKEVEEAIEECLSIDTPNTADPDCQVLEDLVNALTLLKDDACNALLNAEQDLLDWMTGE